MPDLLDLHLYVCLAILTNCKDALEDLDRSETTSMLFSLPSLDVDRVRRRTHPDYQRRNKHPPLARARPALRIGPCAFGRGNSLVGRSLVAGIVLFSAAVATLPYARASVTEPAAWTPPASRRAWTEPGCTDCSRARAAAAGWRAARPCRRQRPGVGLGRARAARGHARDARARCRGKTRTHGPARSRVSERE